MFGEVNPAEVEVQVSVNAYQPRELLQWQTVRGIPVPVCLEEDIRRPGFIRAIFTVAATLSNVQLVLEDHAEYKYLW